jgi:2-polyprenyl-6-hydroxyphenyl methylase/3-demethylubiquinone-9 3-methyltransferase
LLPVGTHSWKKFIRPTELARHLRAAGWRPVATAGLVPNLSSGNWRTTTKPAVNYLLAAAR